MCAPEHMCKGTISSCQNLFAVLQGPVEQDAGRIFKLTKKLHPGLQKMNHLYDRHAQLTSNQINVSHRSPLHLTYHISHESHIYKNLDSKDYNILLSTLNLVVCPLFLSTHRSNKIKRRYTRCVATTSFLSPEMKREIVNLFCKHLVAYSDNGRAQDATRQIIHYWSHWQAECQMYHLGSGPIWQRHAQRNRGPLRFMMQEQSLR